MAEDNILDLEDLARRYDTQVLREYLLEQEMTGTGSQQALVPLDETAADSNGQPRPTWSEVFDMRPRCLHRLRLLLVLNFLAFWSAVGYCGYAYHAHVQEMGLKALPPLDVGLPGFFVLGSQSTLEFAIAACLTQPARSSDARTSGFRTWDLLAWAVGGGARAAILLDVQCLPLLWRGSALLFLLSSTVFAFSIGLFVFVVQLRLVLGLLCTGDHFSVDKPDLFFKGRDVNSAFGEAQVAARPPANREIEEPQDVSELASMSRPPPVGVIKVANCAQLCDLSLVHAVLTRLYIPIGCQETQEFVLSVTSFSRCFCEDVVQCSVKCFFLMDVEMNWLVLLSLFVSATQAVASCLYSSTSSMDIHVPDDDDE